MRCVFVVFLWYFCCVVVHARCRRLHHSITSASISLSAFTQAFGELAGALLQSSKSSCRRRKTTWFMSTE